MSLDSLLLRATTELRSWARRSGLLGPLVQLRGRWRTFTHSDGYEEAFDRALAAAIRPGDVVWDVGANVGLYTQRFRELVGDSGEVVAFEPVKPCFDELMRRVGSKQGVRAFNLALGRAPEVLEMNLASDPLAATHSLVRDNAQGGGSTRVEVVRGDDLRQQHGLRVPGVLKIDVEGFEEDVVAGLAQTLADARCRAVFLEIHFAILEARGEKLAPGRIVETLRGSGFETRWTDGSHLAAIR